jgi:hypothetical protein
MKPVAAATATISIQMGWLKAEAEEIYIQFWIYKL